MIPNRYRRRGTQIRASDVHATHPMQTVKHFCEHILRSPKTIWKLCVWVIPTVVLLIMAFQLVTLLFKEIVIVDEVGVLSNPESERCNGRDIELLVVREIQDIQSSELLARKVVVLPHWEQLTPDMVIKGVAIPRKFIEWVKKHTGAPVIHLQIDLTRSANEVTVRGRRSGLPIKSRSGTIDHLSIMVERVSQDLYLDIDPQAVLEHQYRKHTPDVDWNIEAVLSKQHDIPQDWAYARWGDVLFDRHRYDEALEKYQRSLAVNKQ